MEIKKKGKNLSWTNLMILLGVGFLLYGLGSVIWQYLPGQDPVVLGNGGSLEDANAFRPPMQMESTVTPLRSQTKENGVQPTAIVQVAGEIPDKLSIPAINLEAPVLTEHFKEIIEGKQVYIQWRVPFRKAAGWHDTSARLGEVGNLVLNGHHNAYGEVFKDLINLKEGDAIDLFSGEARFAYQVQTILLLPEKYQSTAERIKNASWILGTEDERVTLVTCWPPESNTHRLIIVAFPLDR